ncbi:MAG: hypothetical protein K6T81_04335 [Alicyclobacillus macrosporangiidus]|uniref:hypothetical protein n=1 Tax=Alicyclobacillus macrosporangiidus TaxID=392015 RepID=UPI0026EF97C2|nr:hypothetical protein [Alicyclobacillus macrosporangiidus]MCL6597947.1 hypothetical protein [Alicyclobacillus macrosporangiidus]
MGWTYSGDPAASDRDRLRFDLGDTVQSDPLLQDEELDYCLSAESSYYGALARACESIAMRFSREASTRVGALSLDLAGRAKQWTERAQEYRRRAAAAHAPSVGGLSKSEEEAALSNPDRTGPYFRKDMMRNRWTY